MSQELRIILKGLEAEQYLGWKARLDSIANLLGTVVQKQNNLELNHTNSTITLLEAFMGLKEDILAQVEDIRTKVTEVRNAELVEDVAQNAERDSLLARITDLEAKLASGLSAEDAALIQEQLTTLREQIKDTPAAGEPETPTV